MYSTLAPSSSSPWPDTTPDPSTTTSELPSIEWVTGGYWFSCGRTNQKSHETHDSYSLIRPLASKIFTRTAVSFPNGMQPLRRHYATTSVGKPSHRGEQWRFVVTEVSQFILYFLFIFEQFLQHPKLPTGMRLVHALHILLARILTRITYGMVCTMCYIVPPSPPHPFLTWTVPST